MSETKQYHIPRADMVMSAPMPFNQDWQARIPVPIAEVGDFGVALQAAYSSLRPGDRVDICSFERGAGEWVRFRAMVSVRVVAKADNKIEAVAVGPVFHVPDRETGPGTAGDKPMLGVFANSQGAFEVRDTKGNIIELFVEKDQAEEFAARENQRTATGRTIKRGYGKFEVRDERTGALIGTYKTKEDAERAAAAKGEVVPQQEVAA